MEQFFELIFAEFERRAEFVKSLVHFTGFEALTGIVQNEELWFNAVRNMNDTSELAAGKEKILEWSRHENHPVASVLLRIQELDPELWLEINQEFQVRLVEEDTATFVSCWMETNLTATDAEYDDLTMWRGYGRNGKGVAVIVDPRAFGFPKVKESEILVWPVFYDRDGDFQDRVYKHFLHFYENLHQMPVTDRHASRSELAAIFGEICFFLAITHKDHRFSAEKEWRFIFRDTPDADAGLRSCVKAKIVGEELREYFCMPIQPNAALTPVSDFSVQKLISEIMIGPTSDERYFMVYNGLQRLLQQCQFNVHQAVVTRSSIPYRG